MNQKPEKVGPEVFTKALRHGVLVHKQMQLSIGGELRNVYPGEVLQPKGKDLDADDPNPGSFVNVVASRNRGRSDGLPRGGRTLSVYATKEKLEAATAELRAQLADRRRSDAWALVEGELRHMNSQGRSPRTVAAVGRLLERTIAEVFPTEIVQRIGEELTEELGLGHAANEAA